MLGVLLLSAATLAGAAIDAANEWRLDEADSLARRAYEVALACDDLAGQSLAVDASAVVARLRGDRDRAVSESTLSLVLGELAGDRTAQARAYNNLGRIDAELSGDFESATGNYRRALELAADDNPLRARILNNIGNLERMRSRRGAALEAFRAALRIADEYARLAAEHNIGLLLAEQNDPRQALRHFERALAMERRLGTVAAARTLLSIAEAHRALGDREQAGDYLSQAAAAAKGDEPALASILLRQADLAIEARRFTDAENALRRSRAMSDPLAVPLVDAYDAKFALARGLTTLAQARAARASSAAAPLRMFDIVAQAESIRGLAALEEDDHAAARDAFDAAIRAVEQQRRGVAGGALARQRFFGRELFPYEQMIALLADTGDAEGALRYADMKRARIIGRSRRSRVRVRGTVVSYAMAGTRIVAIVDSRVITLPAPRDAIVAKANEFAAQLAQRDNGFVATAQQLYALLWAPLGVSGRVRILPDEELWRVPFAALIDPAGRYLAESVTLSYAPAATEIAEDRVVAPASVLLAENLPAHPTEIPALAALYRDARVIDTADEAEVKRSLAGHDVIHIAAHGVLDDGDPLESHLQLRPGGREDGRFTARELMAESLDASLLVLSSCDSASGSVAAGEGLIGMTWAALVAGCPTIVASQWQVPSNTTTEIMIAFHRYLRAGKPVAEALRAAQVAAARQSPHPYYWAPFVVVGR
jgi:tetratricopeptide (TPR) repeat protein